jgi:hypothetical protein
MRFTYFITLILILSLGNGCKTGSNNSNQLGSNNCSDYLLTEINRFVLMVDSIPRSRELQNIIIIIFEKKYKDLFVTLKTSYYYPKKPDGYFFDGSYMVAFYNSSLWPVKELKNCFSKDSIPNKYIREDEVHFRAFEPREKEYQVVDSGSLRLIEYKIN